VNRVVAVCRVEHRIIGDADNREVPQAWQTPEHLKTDMTDSREIREGFQGFSVLGDDPAHGGLLEHSVFQWAQFR
jgi:hypothetical protein